MNEALTVTKDPSLEFEVELVLLELGFAITPLQDPGQLEGYLRSKEYQLAVLGQTLLGTSWRGTLSAVNRIAARTAVMVVSRLDTSEDFGDDRGSTYVELQRPLAKDELASLMSRGTDGLLIALRG